MLIVLFFLRISLLSIMVRGQKVAKPAAVKKPRKVNGYKFPEKLPEGEILKDLAQKHWILGKSIGKGGFGEIYCASKYEDGKYDKSFPFVVKIEPHENGPLFVERNFYLRLAQPQDVETYKTQKKMKILGIPIYLASGNHEYKNEKYRFLIIEKYGRDLWSLFLENKQFPAETVFRCAVQILDVLEYIHSKGYIHGDIKGANLLLSLKKGAENNVFLVDYGLACKYSTQEFKKNPKQAHTGTIEYTSCDWHLGVPTRRGDLEILGFNLLHWLSSSLPWEKDIANNEKVHEKKQALMQNIEANMKKNFPSVSNVMVKYLTYIANMEPNAEPDYDYCRNLFIAELKKMSCPLNGELKFNAVKTEVAKKTVKTPQKKVGRSAQKRELLHLNEDTSEPENELKFNAVKPEVAKKTDKTPQKKVGRSAQKRELLPLNEDISEPENDPPIKKRSKTKYVVDEEENCQPDLNKRQTRSSNTKKVIESDDEIIPGTPEEPNVVKKRTVRAKKVEKADKVNWRDAPTIQSIMRGKVDPSKPTKNLKAK